VIKSIAQTKRAKRAVRKRPDSRPILDVGRPRELPLSSRPNNGIREEHLAAVLAERVMRWGVGPDRFLLSNRCWLPRWRFQPTESMLTRSNWWRPPVSWITSCMPIGTASTRPRCGRAAPPLKRPVRPCLLRSPSQSRVPMASTWRRLSDAKNIECCVDATSG
jgi:hypothetical protein